MKKSFKKITATLVAMAAASSFATAPLSYAGVISELPQNGILTETVTEGEEHVYESYIYTIGSDGITIKSYHGEEAEIIIPAEIDGTAVIAISNSAFAKNTSITSVTIPASVKTIGIRAFSGCSNLEKVTLNEGLVSLDARAFEGTKITSVYIPSTLKEVETSYNNYTGPFSGCAITDVTFSKKPTIIPSYLFNGCKSLKEITLPGNVYKIKNSAFESCSALEKITLLNPYNSIIDDKTTIASQATIHGYDNSTANIYATKYNREFVSLGPIPAHYLGDVDRNGLVDSSDASLILAEYALLSTNGELTFDDDQNKRADINGDGFINSIDASYVLDFYAFTSTNGSMLSDDYFKYLSND